MNVKLTKRYEDGWPTREGLVTSRMRNVEAVHIDVAGGIEIYSRREGRVEIIVDGKSMIYRSER